MVAWLAGPEAGFVTGAIHTIDGVFGAKAGRLSPALTTHGAALARRWDNRSAWRPIHMSHGAYPLEAQAKPAPCLRQHAARSQ